MTRMNRKISFIERQCNGRLDKTDLLVVSRAHASTGVHNKENVSHLDLTVWSNSSSRIGGW